MYWYCGKKKHNYADCVENPVGVMPREIQLGVLDIGDFNAMNRPMTWKGNSDRTNQIRNGDRTHLYLEWRKPTQLNLPEAMLSQYRLAAWNGLTKIPAWISNHITSKLQDEIMYTFSNFNRCNIGVWEWISHFISYLTMEVITYPWN